MKTELITVPLDHFYPGFDPKKQPNIDDYYVDNSIDKFQDQEYYAEYDRWSKARGYWYRHTILPRRYRQAYEMPVKAKEWADDILGTGIEHNLALLGPVGTGKTYAACAVGAYLATIWEDHRRAIGGAPTLKFVSTAEFLSESKNFKGNSEDREVYLYDVAHTLVLILDDAVRSTYTDFDTETLTRLFDERINLGLPTIFTTNAGNPEEIEEMLTDALASRMLGEARVLTMLGPDRRRQ